MTPSMKLSSATAGVTRKRKMNQEEVSTRLTNCPHPNPTTPRMNTPAQTQVITNAGTAPERALPSRSSQVLTGVARSASRLPDSFSSTMLKVAKLMAIIGFWDFEQGALVCKKLKSNTADLRFETSQKGLALISPSLLLMLLSNASSSVL